MVLVSEGDRTAPAPKTQKSLGPGDLASDFRGDPESRVEAVAHPRPQPASWAGARTLRCPLGFL